MDIGVLAESGEDSMVERAIDRVDVVLLDINLPREGRPRKSRGHTSDASQSAGYHADRA